MAITINGKAMADRLSERAAEEARALSTHWKRQPTLAVVQVGEDPASAIYVRRKIAACAKAGIRSISHNLGADVAQAELVALVDRFNADPEVNGILIQLPLPPHIHQDAVLDRIDPAKDVDGFHPVNVGRLSIGSDGLLPCTPMGCMMLLESCISDFRGLNAVVIGKSNIVGKPVALLLLERECTVTVTHILTRNLSDIVRTADILVCAAGAPGLVHGDWVKPGAVVIDVGINRVEDGKGGYRIVGDCISHEMNHAKAVTPVPGGVGPMTIACLLINTVRAAQRQSGLPLAQKS